MEHSNYIVEVVNAERKILKTVRMMELKPDDLFMLKHPDTGEYVKNEKYNTDVFIVKSPPYINNEGAATVEIVYYIK